MEHQFNTSFIPKKSLQEDVSGSKPGKYVNRRTVHGPGFFLMLLVFIITSVAAIAIFTYTKSIDFRVKNKLVELDRDRAAYSAASSTIKELMRADERMKGAERLIASHQALSRVLDALETETLRAVRYESLSFSRESSTNSAKSTPSLTLVGVAQTVQYAALQANEFALGNVFLQPIIRPLERSAGGTAKFGIYTTIDPKNLLYTRVLAVPQLTPPTQPVTVNTESVEGASAGSSTATTTGVVPSNQE